MRTLAPTEVLHLRAAGHDVAVMGRPPGWPCYFGPDGLAAFRRMDWAARRARLDAHECYLTAARVFVGAYEAPVGYEVGAQRRVITAVAPALREAGVPLPDGEELFYTVFAGSPRNRAPGFLTPRPLQDESGAFVLSVQIDC